MLETRMATQLLYLTDFTLLSCQAQVVEVTAYEDKPAIILDQTVFYPQGGGQPADQGFIVVADSAGQKARFRVEMVRFADGLVHHIGVFEEGELAAGAQVKCEVDAQRRGLNSRNHSAGHVVDMAVHALGLGWIPGKGYHFPEGPYVEYAKSGDAPLDRVALREALAKKCNELIVRDAETRALFITKEKMATVCHHVPDYIPEGKPARVILFGDFGVPCGGTHVARLRDIGQMTIRKIKPSSGGKIKVGYNVVG